MNKPIKKTWGKPVIVEFSISAITKQGRPGGGRPPGAGPPPGKGPPDGVNPPGQAKNQMGAESSNNRGVS
ncbi:hypothetical protein EF405_20260 [Cyclobacteriaceae bacterium YHN15]|nr:hypothetical protein EF405_20260 [Cyclobacteriaceae bacterium YHN15]